MREGADQLVWFLADSTGHLFLQSPKPAAGALFGSSALMAKLVEVISEQKLRAKSSLVVCS